MDAKLKKFIQLTKLEKLLFLTSIFLLPLIALILRCFGFIKTKRLFGILSCIHTDSCDLHDKSQKIQITSRIVKIASYNGFYNARCLEQSILVWWFLAIQGIESEIRIGTGKNHNKEFAAHSWVEHSGINITDSKIIQNEYLMLG